MFRIMYKRHYTQQAAKLSIHFKMHVVLVLLLLKGNSTLKNISPKINKLLECGPMPSVMVALPNIGGALCSTP